MSRIALAFRLLVLACAALAVPAQAQNFPTRPIKLVVPYGPGGATDILGRLIAQKMSDLLGQPVVIENRAGAGGVIGADFVAKSAPDGHTLLMSTIGTHGINPVMLKEIPYDAVKDFSAIGLALWNHFVITVHPSVPARNLQELAAASRAKPLFMGVAGQQQQLFGALLTRYAGIQISPVPYKGTAPAMADLAGGSIQMGYTDIAGAMPFIRSGKVVPLAVSGTRRSSLLPDLPTVAEAAKSKELEPSGWMGVLAAARTPPAIVATLNAALNKALAAPDMAEKFAPHGAEPQGSTAQEFATLIREDIQRWTQVAKMADIKPQ